MSGNHVPLGGDIMGSENCSHTSVDWNYCDQLTAGKDDQCHEFRLFIATGYRDGHKSLNFYQIAPKI